MGRWASDMLSLSSLFLIIALILFILAAFGVASSKVNLTALGLAFLTAALLAGNVVVG
jgi:hypothetical protein